MFALKTYDLTKEYNGFLALNKLNLSVASGEIFCLLGQNGAGKTTTINLLLGFITPTSGSAFINDVAVDVGSSHFKKHVAYIPEVVQLYGNLTATENVRFFSKLAGINLSVESIHHYLKLADLQEGVFNKYLRTFSKGMRQKVGIAIALAKQASVIFMDEPTSGLDPKATAEFTRLCKKLRDGGTTIFMATHDIFSAVQMATTIGIMKQGSLVQIIPNKDISATQLQQLYLNTI